MQYSIKDSDSEKDLINCKRGFGGDADISNV